MNRAMLLLLATSVLSTGCAATRLQHHTSKLATTLSDVEEQQILDNIAMFVASPGSTPFFAIPTGAGATTNQSAGAQAALLWNPRALVSESGNLNGTIGMNENWSLKPINEPERINLMKCVFQHVTQTCPTDACSNCDAKLKAFFGDDWATCQVPPCWYNVCQKKPKINKCCAKVGHYCGTYVYVTPEYFEYLSRVTVAILDIATVDSVALAARLDRGGKKTIQIEESFDVGDAAHLTHIKATRKISVADYIAMLKDRTIPEPAPGGAPESDFFQEFQLRPRRETGPAFDSLIQMYGAPR